MDSAADANAPASVSPALKWAGGKRWLVPRLREIWLANDGPNRRLCEPFCGALAVALGLRPREALLRDVNPHVQNFHTQVQRGLRIRIEMENDEASYYAHRAAFNELIVEGRALTRLGASYFFYLNKTGFNGLCRFNSKGLFNVPFGRYKAPAYRREFPELAAALRDWTLHCGDFEAFDVRDDDFLYADPPYDNVFTGYSAGGFDWAAQQRLAHWLARLGGPVLLSNSATPRIVELYGSLGFELVELSGPRSISRNGAGRNAAAEILAVRNVELPPGAESSANIPAK